MNSILQICARPDVSDNFCGDEMVILNILDCYYESVRLNETTSCNSSDVESYRFIAAPNKIYVRRNFVATSF